MDVINGILGEKEFSYFTESDFGRFVKVMDDTVANMVMSYLTDPAANPTIVQHIQHHIGDILRVRTLHKQLHEDGTLQLLRTISPETILSAEIDLDVVYAKLKDLNEISGDILSYMPAREKEDFNAFCGAVDSVLIRIREAGDKPTYPEVKKRLQANSFLFYKPNDRGHATGVGIINYSEQRWKECLHGIEYMRYCEGNGISPIARRAF